MVCVTVSTVFVYVGGSVCVSTGASGCLCNHILGEMLVRVHGFVGVSSAWDGEASVV